MWTLEQTALRPRPLFQALWSVSCLQFSTPSILSLLQSGICLCHSSGTTLVMVTDNPSLTPLLGPLLLSPGCLPLLWLTSLSQLLLPPLYVGCGAEGPRALRLLSFLHLPSLPSRSHPDLDFKCHLYAADSEISISCSDFSLSSSRLHPRAMHQQKR